MTIPEMSAYQGEFGYEGSAINLCAVIKEKVHERYTKTCQPGENKV